MDCYFHNAVPSLAVCRDCTHPICATCRDDQGLCPGCRLERRIQAATAARAGISGGVGPSNPPPPRGPRPESGPNPYEQPQTQTQPQYVWAAVPVKQRALAAVAPETRALLGLGYALWPLAALALLDPKRSPAVRRHAMQALGLNFGMFGLWVILEGLVHVPLLGLPAWPMLGLMFPIWMIATVVYGVRVWQGDDVRVPLVSDYLDQHESVHATS